MRRPTTPTPATTMGNTNNNNTGSRKVSPAISNVQRNRSPIVGASQPNHQQQQSLNIRNFSQVSQRQNQPPASSGSLTGTPLNTGGRTANNMQQHHQSHHQQQQTPTVQVNFPHYPPRSPRVPAGSTPNSARSASCINDLEGVIGEVMRERMNSLTESRKRVEELADLQRRETEMFLSSMEHILASSTVASTAQSDMMEDYEQRLGREKAEKGKMLDILQRFKSEGDRVTSDLKRALFDERDKHREATSKNEQLLSKVRELQGILNKYQQQVKELQQWKSQHQLSGGANAAPSSSGGQLQNNFPQTSSSDNTFQKNNNEAQIFQLVEILKEHERVIDELERRNRNLEYDLKYQQNQKSRLEQRYSAGREGSGSNSNNNGISSSSTTTTKSEEIHIPDDLDLDIDENNNVNKQNNQNSGKSLNSLIQQFASRGDQGASMSPDSLLAMTRGLLGQVRHENRNRLRVEEQYTSLVTDQDSQIRKLESRLRDYETIMQSNGINPNSNSNKSTLGSPSPARVVVAPNHNNNNNNNNTRQQQQQQQQENSNNNSTSTNTKSNHNATTTSSLNQQQQQLQQQQQQQRRQPGGPLPTSSTNASNGPRLPTLTGVGSTSSNPSGSNQNSGTNTPRTSSTNNNNNQTGSSSNVTAAPVLEQPNRQPMIGLDREDRDDVYLQNNNNHNKVAAEYEDDDDVPPSQPPPPTTRSTTTQRQNFRSTTEDDFEPEIRTNRIHSQQQQQSSGRQTSASSSMPSSQENNNNFNNNKAPSVTVSELPSLEDQLNDVTNDFNLSLDMWNKAANGTAASGNNNQKRNVRNDDEFQPDEI